MHRLLLPLAASLALSLALTPLARALARRWGLVDRPDGRRKLHKTPIPLAGGLAIFCSAVTTLGLLLAFAWPADVAVPLSRELVGLALASTIICLVGVVDDLGHLRGRHKLLGQILAVAVLIVSGIRVNGIALFGTRFDLGVVSIPFTAFMLLGAINSLNLLDGMDGLLGTVGLIICMAMGMMAFVNGQVWAACVAFALAGALVGFLVYNLPPASVYLGDTGSMLIGLVIGVLAIQSSLKAPATVALIAPTALLTLPIFDTLAAIVRRKLTGRSIYSTDRSHLHHCLQQRGFRGHRALVLVANFCLLVAVGALGSVAFNSEFIALLSAATVVGILVTCRLFGHAELSLIRARVASRFDSLLPRPGGIRGHASVRLHGELDWDGLWALMVASADELNLRRIQFDVNAPAINERYHARWDRGHEETEEEAGWRVQLPLSTRGRVVAHIEVSGDRCGCPIWQSIATLASHIQDFEKQITLLTHDAFEGTGERLRGARTPPLQGVHAN